MKNLICSLSKARRSKGILVALLVLGGIFSFAQPAQALFGVGDIGLLDLAMMQLDALDFGDKILDWIVFIALLLAESSAFVVVSAFLLDWAVSLPVNLYNPLVLSGWNFFVGLVNISFILLFVFIALAYILKVETFQMKKSLVRLILVILLINFSLVLVGAVTDIGQIFINSFKNAFGDSFVSIAIEPLKASASNLFLFLIIIPSGYVVSALVPYLNIGALIAIITMVMGEMFFGTLSQVFFLIIMNFVMGIIFLFYFFLFIGRIVAIWLLAIFSPLAFFAYVLPQTRKYASKWLHLLLGWTFLGVFAFLLLGLGVKLFSSPEVLNTGGISFIGIRWFPAFGINYLFLAVYLAILFHVSIKYVPTGATQIKGALPMVKKGIQRAQKELLKGRGGIKLERIGGRLSETRLPKEIWKAEMPKAKGGIAKAKVVGKTLASGAFAWVRPLGRRMVSSAQEARRMEISQAEKELEGKSLGVKKEAILNFSFNRVKAVEALRAAIKENELGKLKKLGISDKQIKKIMNEALDIAPDQFGDFRDAKARIAEEIIKERLEEIKKLLEDGKLKKAEKKLKELAFKRVRAGLEFTKEDLKKYDSLADKIYAEIKPEKISRLDEEELEYLATQQNERAPAHKYWTNRHWQEALKSKREKFSDPVQKEINRRGKRWYERNNAALDRFFESSAGQAAGIGYTQEAREKEPEETIPPQRESYLTETESAINLLRMSRRIEKEISSRRGRGRRGLEDRKTPRGRPGYGGGRPPRGRQG